MKKCMNSGKKKMDMRESMPMKKMPEMTKKSMEPKKMAAGGIGKVRKGVY